MAAHGRHGPRKSVAGARPEGGAADGAAAEGRGYVSYLDGEATAYYPIGFPAILGALYWLGNHVPLVDVDLMLLTGVFQVAVSVATVWLTFVVGRRLIGPRAGLAAAGVLALFPNLVYQVTTIQVETTFIFLTMAALAIVVDHDWSSGPPTRNRLLAFGAVLIYEPLGHELLTGNVNLILAAAGGLGVRWPGWWAGPLLSKVTPRGGLL